MPDTKTLTDEQVLARVLDVEAIKTLVHKRVYYQAADLRQAELDDLWVTRPHLQKTASFGRNWGWYVGMENIAAYYVHSHSEALRRQQEENGAPALNTGNLYAHPATTGLVELAGDGKTARGMWYAISQETLAGPQNTAQARWMLEKLAMDFYREADGWKIWHLVVATDLTCAPGEDYSRQPVYKDWREDRVFQEFGTPTLPLLAHDTTFNWWDDYPPMPQPYEHFTDALSYGPEGFAPPPLKGFGAGEGRHYR